MTALHQEEMRHVTVSYLNELYSTIERLNGEVAACHVVLAAVGRRHQGPVDEVVLDRLLDDFGAISAGDMRPEEIDKLTDRQQEVVLLRARGCTWDEVRELAGADGESTYSRAKRAAGKHRRALA